MNEDNFFKSLCSEGTKRSHKRWIAVTTGAAVIWAIYYSVVHASTDAARLAILNSAMIFISVVIGVATAPQLLQLLALIKGSPLPPAPAPQIESVKTTTEVQIKPETNEQAT